MIIHILPTIRNEIMIAVFKIFQKCLATCNPSWGSWGSPHLFKDTMRSNGSGAFMKMLVCYLSMCCGSWEARMRSRGFHLLPLPFRSSKTKLATSCKLKAKVTSKRRKMATGCHSKNPEIFPHTYIGFTSCGSFKVRSMSRKDTLWIEMSLRYKNFEYPSQGEYSLGQGAAVDCTFVMVFCNICLCWH